MNWHIERFETLPSTNDRARERVLAAWQRGGGGQSAHGLVIVASTQSAGHGQHGRTWASPPGGLYLSAVIESVSTILRDKLPLLAAVAVAEALDQTSKITINLRWPNDILIHDKKLGGILSEGLSQGDRWAAILGIGLNITSGLSDFPPALQPYATSVATSFPGKSPSLSQVEQQLLQALTRVLAQAAGEGLAPILARVRKLDALIGKHLEVQLDGQHLTGTAAGIADDGSLLFQTPEGTRALVTATILAVNGRPIRP